MLSTAVTCDSYETVVPLLARPLQGSVGANAAAASSASSSILFNSLTLSSYACETASKNTSTPFHSSWSPFSSSEASSILDRSLPNNAVLRALVERRSAANLSRSDMSGCCVDESSLCMIRSELITVVAEVAISCGDEGDAVSQEVLETVVGMAETGVETRGNEHVVGDGDGRVRLRAVGVVGDADCKCDGRIVRNEAGELERVDSAWVPKANLNSGFATSNGVNLRIEERNPVS